ncbi:MAG: hypothetical protein IJ566_02490, partial [Cardiobacteriaceae bacterium]|nr:hypothetical protein [Cardiobacteriaceae bacterium]
MAVLPSAVSEKSLTVTVILSVAKNLSKILRFVQDDDNIVWRFYRHFSRQAEFLLFIIALALFI